MEQMVKRDIFIFTKCHFTLTYTASSIIQT